MTQGTRQSQGRPAPTTRARSQSAEQAGSQITVTIGQVAGRQRQLKVKQGATVSEALAQAGVTVGQKSVIRRGVSVKRSDVLEDHDVLIVTSNVSGGIR